ncbi:putative signal peptidase I [Medicago truncatula]|uniref:Mitochondrial inner membrane protease subunit 2 n=1 Tax=Medicago truncatula TaxID=3880 RepID=G7K6I3_MEDTR|nr:mitochondrial inner membrane protease subunit 2 [Medicago truncatula]AES93821.2 inner membrane protease subunit, putative [Medicago truncatula]RHN53421.1 putative signal peptidase I [Medicago truncatula]
MMGTRNLVWNVTKKLATIGLITFTVSDRYATVVPVRGASMSPTFNPKTNSFTDDYVFVEKLCLDKFKFSHGDIVIFSSPSNFKETHIKRIIALPGEWFVNRHNQDVLKVPEGHCWVEGDNAASSTDSKSYGPVPLGLVRGRVTHVVWPPQRIGAVKNTTPERLPSS